MRYQLSKLGVTETVIIVVIANHRWTYKTLALRMSSFVLEDIKVSQALKNLPPGKWSTSLQVCKIPGLELNSTRKVVFKNPHKSQREAWNRSLHSPTIYNCNQKGSVLLYRITQTLKRAMICAIFALSVMLIYKMCVILYLQRIILAVIHRLVEQVFLILWVILYPP